SSYYLTVYLQHHSDNGCFWIQWSDIIRWFSHLYICWNIHYYPFQVEMHARWECSPLLEHSSLSDDSHLVAYNPQFLLSVDPWSFFSPTSSSSAKIELCILFTRHVKDRKRDVSQRYLALHVFSGNERVTCPPPPEKQGVYSNGECSLVKLHISREKLKEQPVQSLNYVLVVSQYSQK
ncbi:calpain family cysteine protease domain-containing protein, partial [Cardiosporidium cionae]